MKTFKSNHSARPHKFPADSLSLLTNTMLPSTSALLGGSFAIKKAFCNLATAASFATILASASIAQMFTDVTTEAGFVNEAKKSWGNPIWGDFNNDGFLDLIVPTHGLTFSRGPFVYLNNGDGTFTDIRTTCGIQKGPEDDKDWHGFSFGDYDGDGRLDLYIAEGGDFNHGGTIKRDLLYRGLGNGTFRYVSNATGIETSMNRGRCSVFFDYDNDGLLDLFVKNFASANVLYKNNGNGTFAIVPDGGGLREATSGLDHGSIVSMADYDNDGFMDIAMTGDGNAEALYKNMGNGTFVDVTSAAGIIPRANGKGLAWGDYDNDGLLDLYVARGHTSMGGTAGGSLYRNNGDGTFTDVTTAAGLSSTANEWAAVWGDYDNDGFLDLFVTNAGHNATGVGNANLLYRNSGDGTFTDVAAAEGVALEDGISLHKTTAWGDYDNDGFLDLVIKDGVGDSVGCHRLLKNLGNGNHFIKVNLVGTQSNIAGIGARVAVTSTNGQSFRQNNGGGGGEYASQGSEPLHFGIRAATQATVEVIWPSGVIDRISGVLADSTLTITEGTSPR